MRARTKDPEERLERLLSHVRRGWERVGESPAVRARALGWLERHPTAWSELDRAWSQALSGEGELASWLDAGGRPESWRLELPLHSVLASHPFACLSPWSTPARSSRS